MRFFALILLLSLSLSSVANEGVIQLDKQSYQNIGKKLIYLEDKTGELTLNEVKKLYQADKFKQSKDDILNFGNSKSTFWIRILYQNTTGSGSFLVVDVPNLEIVECYTTGINGKAQVIKSGSLSNEIEGVIAKNNFIFSLSKPDQANDLNEVYLRIKTNNFMLVPIKLISHEVYIAGSALKQHIESIYIGVLITLLLLNIFLYISLHEKMYLFYGLYLLAGFVYLVLYLRGYAYLFEYDFRIIIYKYPHFFLALSSMAGILFSWKFLNLDALLPRVKPVYYFMMSFALALMIVSLLGYKSTAASMIRYTTLFISLGLGAVGIVSWNKGHRPAKFYIVAWLFRVSGIVLINLNLFGILELRDYTFEIFPITTTIEMLLLAFALGDRYSMLISSEREAREGLMELVQTQNQRLEHVVEERTLKLSETIVELESSNRVKDKLFSIVAHDLRTPFNSLISIFSLKDMGMLNFEELKMLLNANRKNIDQMRLTLDNLLFWAKDQMNQVSVQFTEFDLKKLSEVLMLVYEPIAQSKNIRLELNANEGSMVYADENQVKLILRNLIDNAVKFSPEDNTISINLERQPKGLRVAVHNVVLNPAAVKSALEGGEKDRRRSDVAGAANESGTGLGLQLCREYMKANGSQLQQNIIGNEVELYFFLKDNSSNPAA
ncbi:histidine kinase [Pedobacter ginsengisoli]|uniref:histidine kinase n=1 Tax=Pedobacter ginsengisoli TaxID=363852 RepID=A0A2D1U3E0_9SPHI|nr:sensor histidine kinase [Pedobacter ginsengisoli]ATP56113.1 histidine kinase [Pedobacter ginsengisoli]